MKLSDLFKRKQKEDIASNVDTVINQTVEHYEALSAKRIVLEGKIADESATFNNLSNDLAAKRKRIELGVKRELEKAGL